MICFAKETKVLQQELRVRLGLHRRLKTIAQMLNQVTKASRLPARAHASIRPLRARPRPQPPAHQQAGRWGQVGPRCRF